MNILSVNINMFWVLNETFFEYPQHMFCTRNKKVSNFKITHFYLESYMKATDIRLWLII